MLERNEYYSVMKNSGYGDYYFRIKQAERRNRYVPCEYIGFDGSSWLDLAPLTTESDIEITFRKTATSTAFLFGTNPTGSQSGIVGAWVSATNLVVQNGNSRKTIANDTDWHTLKITSTKTYVDGVEYNAGSRTDFQNLVIGSARDQTSGAVDSRGFKGDISRVKVGNKIFVAGKDVTANTFGLIDPAENKFYGNKGTGTIAGGSLIQPISYAQTDGSACADTDLLLNGSEKWTMKFASLKSTLSTPVAGSLNGGTAFTDQNNFCVTYTTATSPARYSVYVDGNAGATNNSWNGGLANDKAWHILEYFGDVNTAPKLDGVAMATIGATARISVTPSVPWRLFGRATTAKGQGTKSQDGVAIARFTGDTWDFIPVRIGASQVELLDLVNWQFATRTGTFTAGEDIPWDWEQIPEQTNPPVMMMMAPRASEENETISETETADEGEIEETETEENAAFVCPICGKEYTSEYWFNKHLTAHDEGGE